ncbi:MAG TPA: hypothetical protein VD770_01780 [Coxiellaceae bacterium]|nr:hypothetical protein [Coxiellaceae bacterium]
MTRNASLIASNPSSRVIVNEYVKALQSFAKQNPNLNTSDLFLRFDGTQTKFLTGFLPKISSLNSNTGLDHHPLIELIDSLFAYMILYPEPSIKHDAQHSIMKLCKQIDSSLKESANRDAAETLGHIRVAVWEAVQGRDHGLLHDAGWLFLARTATRDRALQFSIPSSHDIIPYEGDPSVMDQKPVFKSYFKKTIAASQHNPGSLQFFIAWLSMTLKWLFSTQQNQLQDEDNFIVAKTNISDEALVEAPTDNTVLRIRPVPPTSSFNASPSAASSAVEALGNVLEKARRSSHMPKRAASPTAGGLFAHRRRASDPITPEVKNASAHSPSLSSPS